MANAPEMRCHRVDIGDRILRQGVPVVDDSRIWVPAQTCRIKFGVRLSCNYQL